MSFLFGGRKPAPPPPVIPAPPEPVDPLPEVKEEVDTEAARQQSADSNDRKRRQALARNLLAPAQPGSATTKKAKLLGE